MEVGEVPRRIWADPEAGYPGTWEEKDGTRVEGTYRFLAHVYGPDETPHSSAESIAELRAKYWDDAVGALVIPFTRGRTFTFGPKLLSDTSDATMVVPQITFSYPHAGPPPEICSCGKLTFRHAVEYHRSADSHLGPASL
jgi:hypothetical protein